jgi:hypothetical protein
MMRGYSSRTNEENHRIDLVRKVGLIMKAAIRLLVGLGITTLLSSLKKSRRKGQKPEFPSILAKNNRIN